jgi:hypothetical protein
MLRKIIAWLLKNATFSIYDSPESIGRRLGSHRLPYHYIIISIAVGGQFVLLGYFEKA